MSCIPPLWTDAEFHVVPMALFGVLWPNALPRSLRDICINRSLHRTVVRLPALHYPLPLRSRKTKSLCAILKRKDCFGHSQCCQALYGAVTHYLCPCPQWVPHSAPTFVDWCVKRLEPCTPCQDSGSQASGTDPGLKVRVTVVSPG